MYCRVGKDEQLVAQPLIELRDLKKVYPVPGGEVVALGGVSLKIEKGEIKIARAGVRFQKRGEVGFSHMHPSGYSLPGGMGGLRGKMSLRDPVK